MAAGSNLLDDHWWKAAKNKVHARVRDAMTYYDKNQDERRLANLLHMRLYNNRELVGLFGRYYARSRRGTRRIALNIIKSMCDTVVAKICKNKPRPMLLTKDGNWSMQRKGKRLTKFVEGVFYQESAYKKGSSCMLDCTVFSKGFITVYGRHGRIHIERIFPAELIVDSEEARYGDPKTIYRRKYINRTQLIEDWPEHKAAIKKAKSYKPDSQGYAINANDDQGSAQDDKADQVETVEAWHLQSDPKGKAGRHAIVIDTATLLDEDYKHDFFPIAEVRWDAPLLGWWPLSLAEELTELQREINRLLRRIADAMHRISVPRVWLEAGSKVVKSHITNQVGMIGTYQGTPPIFDTPPAVPEQMLAHLDRLYQRAYEIAGVSQLSASSAKPAGLNSGVALREYLDNETERFSQKAQSYEQFYVDIAKLVIIVARELHAKDSSFAVTFKGRRSMERIKWADVDMAADSFVLQAFPTNFLPSTPAGKLATVQEMIEAGMLDKETAMSLLDYPDLEAANSLINAPLEDIKAMIEGMLDNPIDDAYEPPEPYQNLTMGLRVVLSAYLKAKRDGAPQERLELLRVWMEDAKVMMDEAQAAAAPPIPPPVGPPPGGPPTGPVGLPPPGAEGLPPELAAAGGGQPPI